ncbi:MAG: DegT/DnrJ/EryC1/StrS family aminotransferase, partial [Patescibacteria group bacterium]
FPLGEIQGQWTNWLTFPLIIKKEAPFTRYEITKYLEECNIQTRPVMAGNILRQPGFEKVLKSEKPSAYPAANYIMERAFLVGCHQGLNARHLAYLKSAFSDFLERYMKK